MDVLPLSAYLWQGEDIHPFFVHTLLTSPAEAALLFGLRGPNFYLRMPDARIADLFDTAADVLRAGGAGHMLAVAADGRRAMAWLLRAAGAACAWPAWAALPFAPLPPASVFMTARGKGSGASVQCMG